MINDRLFLPAAIQEPAKRSNSVRVGGRLNIVTPKVRRIVSNPIGVIAGGPQPHDQFHGNHPGRSHAQVFNYTQRRVH